MNCQYFGICGGCNNFALDYTSQIRQKYERTLEEFVSFLAPQNVDIEVFSSPQSGFRARTELRFFRLENTLSFAMSALESSHKVPITSCLILRPILQSLMPLLCDLLNTKEVLKTKLYACNLLCNLPNGIESNTKSNENMNNEEVIITLIYHKYLDILWEAESLVLQEKLKNALGVPIHIIGRSKNQVLPLGKTSLCETLYLLNGTHHYTFFKQEGAFSQPNPFINIKMLEFVASSLKNFYPTPQYDALELYCGSGNFTLMLSSYFQKILATEVVKSAITQLKINMTYNQIHNIFPVRLNALESIQALREERAFFRLREIVLKSFRFDCVLIDPPRSGVGDTNILHFLQDFATIIYISCNPLTLLQDLQILSLTHNIVRCGLFDQFPYTLHRECVMILRRK